MLYHDFLIDRCHPELKVKEYKITKMKYKNIILQVQKQLLTKILNLIILFIV